VGAAAHARLAQSYAVGTLYLPSRHVSHRSDGANLPLSPATARRLHFPMAQGVGGPFTLLVREGDAIGIRISYVGDPTDCKTADLEPLLNRLNGLFKSKLRWLSISTAIPRALEPSIVSCNAQESDIALYMYPSPQHTPSPRPALLHHRHGVRLTGAFPYTSSSTQHTIGYPCITIKKPDLGTYGGAALEPSAARKAGRVERKARTSFAIACLP